MKPKEKSLQVLVHDLDDVFSQFIRVKNSSGGYCHCFVCGARVPIKLAQNGHYIDRDQMMTRYDERNCHQVCIGCNVYDPNHHERYRAVMVAYYGKQAVDELELAARSLAKFMRHELVEKIDHYKVQLKQLSAVYLPH